MLVESRITEYLHSRASTAKIPINGAFELTPVCNMDCRMCYVRMSPRQQRAIAPLRSMDEWLVLAETCRDAGMLYLLLTGGEPFLLPELPKLMNGLSSLGLFTSINTNATLINESTVAWMRDCAPTRLNITLYGASDETYARLCNHPQGFTRVSRAVELLKSAGFSVKFNFSMTPQNAADLDAMFALSREWDVPVQVTAYMFPPVRKDAAAAGQYRRFTPAESAACAARSEWLLRGTEEFRQMCVSGNFPVPPQESEDACTGEGGRLMCRAGKCSFWVTWRGKLMPCGMFPETTPGLNVFEDGFDAAWQQAVEFADSIRLPAKCGKCELARECQACAAMCLAETGSFDTVPEYRCEMYRAYPAACRTLLEELKA